MGAPTQSRLGNAALLRSRAYAPRFIPRRCGRCHTSKTGSQICYDLLKLMSAPSQYIPSAGPLAPMEHLVAALPKLGYQLFFNQDTPGAIAELNKDVRRTIRGTLRTVASPPPDEFLKSHLSFLDGWKDVAEVDLIFYSSSQSY